MNSSPLVSIIIPVHNGMPYIAHSVESVLKQKMGNLEVIVSVSESSDGSLEYLETIRDPRLSVYRAPSNFSMAEHWEWCGRLATGQWQMFLGQDDLLMNRFTDFIVTLVEIASKTGCRIITGKRALFEWPGLDGDYRMKTIQTRPDARVQVRKTLLDTLLALSNLRSYHQMPQMYTSSLFSKSLLSDIRAAQGGALFVCHPQDANLAALAARFESRYLFCRAPFSWVGTSPKSAGLAVALAAEDLISSKDATLSGLAEHHPRSVEQSTEISYPWFAGDFRLAENSIYFWQALLMTRGTRPIILDWLLDSRFLKTHISIFVMARLKLQPISARKRQLFLEFLSRNQIPIFIVGFFSSLARTLLRVFLEVRETLDSLRTRRRLSMGKTDAQDEPELLPESAGVSPNIPFVAAKELHIPRKRWTS